MLSSLFIDLTLKQQELIAGGANLSALNTVLEAHPEVSLPVSSDTDLDTYISDKAKKAITSKLAGV
jgi:hypothetical protein